MTSQACARSWIESRNADDRQRLSCQHCPIGAAHAGKPVPPPAPEQSWRCCRCGQGATVRILGGVFCVSCRNRNADCIKWSNGKGTAPTETGKVLRPGWAILHPAAAVDEPVKFVFANGQKVIKPQAPALAFDRLRSWLTPNPSIFRISGGRRMIWAIVASQDELERIIAKRLPGNRVEHIELEPSFSEFNHAEVNVSEWLRECAPS